ncbi:Hypothetical predicted protein [Pelobates cultripes]|uniref:Uncharacterized protein n=1 Tax=Pelobates cultripes TaxID=61616 RepID=A0AAD1SB22_PELCU|nr:Hypothetical predicted protein [Pelobates cultripes]
MVVLINSATQGKQLQQPEMPSTTLNVRDSLDDIFDRFWAQLLARTRPAVAIHAPPTGDQVRSTRRPGKRLMLSPTPTLCKRCPPGLRAQQVQTHRYRPHKRRAARRTRQRTPDPHRAHTALPTGKTDGEDLEGLQARGQRVPALAQLQGRRGTSPPQCCIAPLSGLSPYTSGDHSSIRKSHGPQHLHNAAFFSKRSFPPVYAENTQYNSLNSLCLSCPEECTDIITRNTYQQIGGMKREIQDIRSHICFVVCAAKCLKNWNNL